MNKNFILVSLSALLCFFISSCKKDQLLLSSKSQIELVPDVTIEDDYLKFKNDRVFDSLSTLLMKRPGSTIGDFVDGVAGFKSYGDIFLALEHEYESVNDNDSFNKFRNKYKSLVGISGDSSLTYKFGTPLSSKFVNLGGEVKVGDHMIVYTKDSRIISYKGARKTEDELRAIKYTDSLNGISVQNVAVGNWTSKLIAVANQATTSLVASALYYNGDGKRRLLVECWVESYVSPNRTRVYVTSKQELKKTFGGWRTNETNYSFNNVKFNSITLTPPSYPVHHEFILNNYSINNVYGPILIDMGINTGFDVSGLGFGNFTSGGVPNAPQFGAKWPKDPWGPVISATD